MNKFNHFKKEFLEKIGIWINNQKELEDYVIHYLLNEHTIELIPVDKGMTFTGIISNELYGLIMKHFDQFVIHYNEISDLIFYSTEEMDKTGFDIFVKPRHLTEFIDKFQPKVTNKSSYDFIKKL